MKSTYFAEIYKESRVEIMTNRIDGYTRLSQQRMLRGVEDAMKELEKIQENVAAKFLVPDNEFMKLFCDQLNIETKPGSVFGSFGGIPVEIYSLLPPDVGMFVNANGKPLDAVRINRDEMKP